MSNNRRFLAFVIALAMVLTMIPGAVFADGYPEADKVNLIKVASTTTTEAFEPQTPINYGDVLYADITYKTSTVAGILQYQWQYRDANSIHIISEATGPYYTVGDYVGPSIIGTTIKCLVSQDNWQTDTGAWSKAKVTHELTDEQLASVFTTTAAVYTYDGQSHSPVKGYIDITVGDAPNSTTYALSLDTHYSVKYKDSYNNDVAGIPSASGTYNAIVTFDDNTYGLVGTTTAAFQILPRKLVLQDFKGNDKTFDGTTNAALESFRFRNCDVVTGESISLSNVEAVFDSPNVGSRTVTIINTPGAWSITGSTRNNYFLAEEGHITTKAGIITKASIVPGATSGIDTFVVTGFNGEYDGAEHSITVIPPTYGEVKYSTTSGGPFTSTNPAFKAVDDYEVYYKISGENINEYNGTTNVAISQRELQLTWSGLSVKYDGSSHVPTATAKNVVSGEAITITVAGAATVPGIYTATATAVTGAAASNYKLPTNRSTSFTITNAEFNPSDINVTSRAVDYDGNEHSLTGVTYPTGSSIKYRIDEDAAGYTRTTIPAFTNAGSYNIGYKVEQDNHTSVTGTAVLTINPAKIFVTASAVSKTYGTTDPALTYTSSCAVAGAALEGALTRAAGENAGSYAITKGSLAPTTSNFAIEFTGANFTISKAALTVTAIDNTITYGEAPTGAGVEYSDFVNGDTSTSAIGGDLTYTSNYVKFDNVGAYKITPQGITATNYAITFVAGKLTVTQKALGIEWGNTNLVYNGTAQAPAATPTGIENNDVVSFVIDGKVIDASINYVATATALDGAKKGNYKMPTENLTTTFAIAQAQASYVVTPKAIENLVYNGAEQVLVTTGSATGGTVKYSTDGAVWSTDAPKAKNATTYAVYYQIEGNNNYIGVTSASIDVTIALRQATVAAIDQSKYTDEDDPVLTATVSGLVNNDSVTYTAVRTPDYNYVGKYTITVSGAATQGNYTVVYVPGTFTINARESTIDITPKAINREYDGTERPLVTTGSATGGTVWYKLADDANYSENVPEAKDAGTYVVFYMVSPDNTHSATVPDTIQVTISRKNATISAIDQTVTYGAAEAELTVTASGLVGNDTVEDAAVYTISRTSGSAVGTYPITVTEAGVSTNYAITYVNGTYTITTGQAVIVTAPAVKDLVYDGTSQELIITGDATLGDIEYSLDGTTFAAVVPKATDAGIYTVYYQVPDYPNYHGVAVATMAATIAPKAATVSAVSTTKALGASDPVFTATVEGSVSGVAINYIVTRAATETSENAGEHEIIVTEAAVNPNYTVTYINGTLTIEKAASSLTVDPTSKAGLVYDGTAQELIVPGTASGGTIQYSFNGTTFSAITPTGINADTYTVYYKVVGDNNHSDSDVASLTAIIAPKAATISAVNNSKVYGTSDPALTLTAAGLVGNDKVGDFALEPVRVAGENVSTYAIAVSGAALQGSYSFTFEPGEFEITQAALTDLDLTGISVAIPVKAGAADTGERSFDLADIYDPLVSASAIYAGTIAYTSNAGYLEISGTPSVVSKVLSFIIGADDADKEGTIELTVSPDDTNYKPYKIILKFKTAAKTSKTELDTNGVATSISAVKCDDLQTLADNTSGTSVQVEMSVNVVSEGGITAGLKNNVSTAALNTYGTNAEDKVGKEYLDIDIEKTVDGGAPAQVTDAGVVLEIIIDCDLTGKESPIVGHEKSDGSFELFTELTSKPAVKPYPDKSYYLDKANNKIYIYSRYYSPFVILYAKAATHTITFNANGGTPATKTQTVVDNTATNLVANTFTRASYSFKGWNTAANGTGTAYADKASVTLTTAMALYAQWTYNGGGGGSGSGGGGGGATTVKPTTTAAVTTSAVTYKNCTKDGKCAMAKFPDLVTNAWYHDGVHFVLDKGIMHGESNGKFEPDNETSRSMIAQILWNMEGNPVVNYAITYSDMTQYHWYADAVRWTSAMNIMKGDSEGTFRGEDSLTREELAAVLYRFAQLKGQGFTGMWSFPLDYPDASKVDDWAYEAMCWMTMNGIIKGDEKGDLAPQATATRAEMATMIMRLCESLGL